MQFRCQIWEWDLCIRFCRVQWRVWEGKISLLHSSDNYGLERALLLASANNSSGVCPRACKCGQKKFLLFSYLRQSHLLIFLLYRPWLASFTSRDSHNWTREMDIIHVSSQDQYKKPHHLECEFLAYQQLWIFKANSALICM